LRGRIDFAGDAALLRHRRPPGVAGLRTDRKRRRRLHPDRGSHHRSAAAACRCRDTEWKLDSDGEILLRNPGVFKGYFLDEKASTASLEPAGWLRTGDIVEVMDNGEIAVVDRKKAIIITAAARTSRLPKSRTR
jgi:acyl-CoA synthetase (AMP-forming)/AMP-acid ligase II